MPDLYLDCSSGVSGDMLVGALLDLGASIDELDAALQPLALEGFQLRAEQVTKRGVRAAQFHVDVDPSVRQPHRHLKPILESIARAGLPEPVARGAAATFQRLGEAEAAVHGVPIEKVHFHEVGAIDSIVDIVGAHFVAHRLGINRIIASPLHVGGGTVKCAHGIMPVPAPATALLLRSIPCYGSDVDAELVTPTGAALVGSLAESFGPMPLMQTERIGHGSGTRDLEGRTNVLRAFLGAFGGRLPGSETVTVIETTLDDMNPELVAALAADLIQTGARDVFTTPVLGKKGRNAILITLLCDESLVHAMADMLFRRSTTFGLRMRTEQRYCLDRTWGAVATPWGPVKVKIGSWQGETIRFSPEFEDCRRVADAAGASPLDVYNAAQAAAARGEWSIEEA